MGCPQPTAAMPPRAALGCGMDGPSQSWAGAVGRWESRRGNYANPTLQRVSPRHCPDLHSAHPNQRPECQFSHFPTPEPFPTHHSSVRALLRRAPLQAQLILGENAPSNSCRDDSTGNFSGFSPVEPNPHINGCRENNHPPDVSTLR